MVYIHVMIYIYIYNNLILISSIDISYYNDNRIECRCLRLFKEDIQEI